MARPCFPFPLEYTTAELWDGTTRYLDSASNSSSSYVPVCGPGTSHPIGLTLEELAWWRYRVRIFHLNINMEATRTFEAPPDPPETLSFSSSLTDMKIPGGSSHLIVYGGYDPTESPSYTDLNDWWEARESSGVRDFGFAVQLRVYRDYGGSVSDPVVANTATTNFSAGEIVGSDFSTAVVGSGGYTDLIDMYLDTGSGTGLLFSGGLYYPFIRLDLGPFHGYSGDSGGYISSAKSTLWVFTDGDEGLTVESLTTASITINGAVKTFDIYHAVAGSDPDYTYSTKTVSITPHKYWPYKDAAGVALYDEDTGALL